MQRMKAPEKFGECLQRLLDQEGMSASEAARLVGFRSRNSIFRILNDETSFDVDSRFLTSLHKAVGESWPESHWEALEDAIYLKKVGLGQMLKDRAFLKSMHEVTAADDYTVESNWYGQFEEISMRALLADVSKGEEIVIVISGSCKRDLAALLIEELGRAGDEGRLKIRQYIDIGEDVMVYSILGALPLLSKVWYNARLVEPESCPPELEALYRLNTISIYQKDSQGQCCWHEMIQIDSKRFVHRFRAGDAYPFAAILERKRFELELLKPIARPDDGAEAFIEYTSQYAALEKDGMILSIKPDVHFNCIASEVLYPAIIDGFRQAGFADGEELTGLISALKQIHDARYHNMFHKRRPTHLVYSIQAMERFMQTGVLTDQFFIQRAYTVEERRTILREMHREAVENPYFNIYFLKEDVPELRSEMTLYEGKGVLLLDAYTGYDLHEDHSEALITLPPFMESFQRFFMEQLLHRYVLPKAESIAVLERLYTDMKV